MLLLNLIALVTFISYTVFAYYEYIGKSSRQMTLGSWVQIPASKFSLEISALGTETYLKVGASLLLFCVSCLPLVRYFFEDCIESKPGKA